ncbi:uncharacterized protein LOC132952320 isoform X2 [Metopolophium dirhodum]|uniref:uncharacterized protein LOC132952320 isoform X2 n=1 Tax=Metopolophium dirhodum TaxID=44670 RepID=UPI0029907E99|nr:uncharacterized protein LOC132952320 isoform X2 [Metopolophium dirhodum]
MNIRGAAGGGGSGDGSGSPSDAGYSAALVDVGRKMLAMDGLRLRPIRTTGPSPVAHNGRYWTPDRRRENAETVRYIRCLVQTCEAIKPWTAAGYQTSSAPQTRTKVTMDQLPRIMQKVLGNKIRSNRDHKFVNYWTPSDFVKNCLFWHNFYRHFHRSTELVLSPHLCEEAQNWANHLAHTETFAYQNKINYGQNLFCRKPTNTEIEGKDVVREWYSSSRVYKPRKNPKMYSANINSGKSPPRFAVRSFHAAGVVEHKRVGRRKSVQPVWSDNRRGQLPAERKRQRTVRQQRAHEPILFAGQ